MATSKTYFARTNYRFLTTDRPPPIPSDSVYELDESDIWNSGRSTSPEFRKGATMMTSSRKNTVPKPIDIGAGAMSMAKSLPVNVPDWAKILKQDYRDNRRRDFDEDFEEDEEEDRVPPHEYLARQFARNRVASYSVHEGFGRTLKGRDLSRVRNAIWEKTGFED